MQHEGLDGLTFPAAMVGRVDKLIIECFGYTIYWVCEVIEFM